MVIGDTIQDGSVTWKVNKALGLIGGGDLTGDALTFNANDLAGAAVVDKSLGENGYIKYANGLIIQWGKFQKFNLSAGYQNTPIDYPIAFPYGAALCLVQIRRGSNANIAVGAEPNTKSAATLYFTMPTNESALGINYIAIGW